MEVPITTRARDAKHGVGVSSDTRAPNAVVTLSLGNRPFVQHTRPLMAAYAARIGADFHCVETKEHASLRSRASDCKRLRRRCASSSCRCFRTF